MEPPAPLSLLVTELRIAIFASLRLADLARAARVCKYGPVVGSCATSMLRCFRLSFHIFMTKPSHYFLQLVSDARLAHET